MNIYHAILQEWKSQWEKKYPGRTFSARNFHYKQLKDALKPAEGFNAEIDLSEVFEKIKIYLNTSFYKVCAHNISVFLKNYDSFVPPPRVQQSAHVLCKRCGEIIRRTDIPLHKCDATGDELARLRRETNEPKQLNQLLPQQ
ncbi:MAG: hypothetical protein H3C35_08480 [Bacteroidetes bacterium]|nr:hypothetical protein [Bacteroidota bacterium]